MFGFKARDRRWSARFSEGARLKTGFDVRKLDNGEVGCLAVSVERIRFLGILNKGVCLGMGVLVRRVRLLGLWGGRWMWKGRVG